MKRQDFLKPPSIEPGPRAAHISANWRASIKKLAWLGVIVILTPSALAVARAQESHRHHRDRDESRACSTETLEGVYGISISGARPAANFPPGTSEQVIGVGTQAFDGDGHFTQTTIDKGSLTGLSPARSGSGTYTVNADCTGTTTLQIQGVPFPIVSDIVIVSDGREIRAFVASPPPSMVTTSGRRVN